MPKRVAGLSTKESYEEVLGQLVRIAGREWVSDDPEILIAYSRDRSLETARNPDIVVLPGSTEQVSKIVKLAYRRGIAVTPWSSGANALGGCIPRRGGILLDMSRMDEIIGIDEENMSVRIQPGVTFAQVYLRAEKLGLGSVRPCGPGSISMLAYCLEKGVLQASARYGVGADSILGMVVVLPDGNVLRTGCLYDERYGSISVEGPGPDISGIFQGALGVFGICTEMVARLYPLPVHEDMLVVERDEGDRKVLARLMREVARGDCATDIFLWDEAFPGAGRAVERESREAPQVRIPGQSPVIFIGGETETELGLRREQLKGVLRRVKARLVADSTVQPLKESIPRERAARMTKLIPGTQRKGVGVGPFWFNVLMEQAPVIASALAGTGKKRPARTGAGGSGRPHGPEIAVSMRPTEFGRSAVVRLDANFDRGEPEGVKAGLALARHVMKTIAENGGFCDRPYWGADSGFDWLQAPLLGTYFEVLEGMKKRLDPQDIMNPGRMGMAP